MTGIQLVLKCITLMFQYYQEVFGSFFDNFDTAKRFGKFQKVTRPNL